MRLGSCDNYCSQAQSTCGDFRLHHTCSIIIINPRRACAARVTVLGLSFCLSFCLSVCLSGHAILAVRAIESIMKDTIVLSVRFAAILKWRFS